MRRINASEKAEGTRTLMRTRPRWPRFSPCGAIGSGCHHHLVDLQAGPGASKRSACVAAITIDRKLIPLLLQLPSQQPWIDYDAEGDVLYLSFEKPQQATDSVMGE